MAKGGRALARAALGAAVLAGPAAAEGRPEVTVGYVSLAGDARYAPGGEHAGIAFRDEGRPLAGALTGLADARAIGDVVGVDFRLLSEEAEDPAEVAARWAEEGVAFILADLPPEALVRVADAVAGEAAVLNVSAMEDRLRGGECRANLLHVVPSRAMLADALAQHLADKGWTRVLALRGEAEADAEGVAALRRAAQRFGLEVVEERAFELTRDPRRRDWSNVALMTADVQADVVYVADDAREFARYVPYETARPMLVVGDAGLSPTAWHWSWDRYGAPQVQHRFEETAPPRRMNGADWAAWVAMKIVAQAAMRSDPTDPQAMLDYVTGPELKVDGSKGAPMSFRPWSGQLRQPILLATPEAVIAEAPLEPFLHRTDDLDTLGVDAPESGCVR